MDISAFDPTEPLPGPPEPWASTDQPSRRDGPPFHMTEMIDAEPAVAARILERHEGSDSAAAKLARAIATAVRAGTPIVVTGCGTSEHAALAIVEVLREAIREARLAGPGGGPAREPIAAQAFELALDPPTTGLVIGVSHEGATGATNAALSAARAAGARVALITVSDRSPGADLADIVVETGELDQGWCHTVGYVSPIVAGAAVAAHLARRPRGADARGAIRDLLAAGLDRGATAETIAAALTGKDRILVIASGVDRPSGRELVLKIEEGTWIPAAYRDLETLLHGHLAATDGDTGLLLILATRDRRPERLARATAALRAARIIGMDAAAIVTTETAAELPTDLTPAGRVVLPESPGLPDAVAALLGTATALQLVTERLARARGVDPDAIHREVDRYREAADAAG